VAFGTNYIYIYLQNSKILKKIFFLKRDFFKKKIEKENEECFEIFSVSSNGIFWS